MSVKDDNIIRVGIAQLGERSTEARLQLDFERSGVRSTLTTIFLALKPNPARFFFIGACSKSQLISISVPLPITGSISRLESATPSQCRRAISGVSLLCA